MDLNGILNQDLGTLKVIPSNVYSFLSFVNTIANFLYNYCFVVHFIYLRNHFLQEVFHNHP